MGNLYYAKFTRKLTLCASVSRPPWHPTKWTTLSKSLEAYRRIPVLHCHCVAAPKNLVPHVSVIGVCHCVTLNGLTRQDVCMVCRRTRNKFLLLYYYLLLFKLII